MNKPGQESDATIFLVVLGVIGIALPAFLCGGVFLLFGFSAPVRRVGPAVVTTLNAPTTIEIIGGPTTLPPPGVSGPTTLPPSSFERDF